MLQLLGISLQTNFLWNGMTHANLASLFETYEPLVGALQDNDFFTLEKIVISNYSDPVLGPIIFLGIVPIVLSIISLLICICVNLPVCCCGKYLRYMKTQKKLDKKLVIFIKGNKIPYNFKPGRRNPYAIMFDTCAEADDLPACNQINELNDLHRNSDAQYLKAFKCQCWTTTFYILFFILMFIYIITMFVLALGAKSITQLPITVFNSVQSVSKSAGDQLMSTLGSIDKSVNELAGTTSNPVPVFVSLMNGTEQQYLDNFNQIQTDALELKQLKPLALSLNAMLERNDDVSLTNQKSLARWLENLLFWPQTNSNSYIINGNQAAKVLHDHIYNMNQEVYKINGSLSDIKKNIKLFPQDIQNNIPIAEIEKVQLKNISELILNSSSGSTSQTQQDLSAVVKLLEKQTVDKYVFANAIAKVVQQQQNQQIQLDSDMFEVFINKTLDANGQLINVKRTKPLYAIMEPLLGQEVLDMLNGESLLQKLKDMLSQSNIFFNLEAYQPYFAVLNMLQNMTVDEFLEQLCSTNCSYFWCGILPEGTFEQINNMLESVPVIGNMLAYKNGPSELLQNSQPLVIAICTLVPIILIISLTISMACCKSCCPICVMCSCSLCSLVVSIISFVLLIASFLNSGLIQSVSYKMENDNAGLINSVLTIGKTSGLIQEDTITLPLPSTDMIIIEPAELTIPLTNIYDILKSIKFTVSLKPQATGNQSDIMSILLPDGFNLSVSLEGMDINKLFASGKSRSILQLIPGQNGTFLNDLKVQLTKVIQAINTESISKLFGDSLNITQKLNIDDILKQININDIFDELQKTNFSGLSNEINTTVEKVKAFIQYGQPQAENEIIFNKVTKAIQDLQNGQTTQPNITDLINITINGTTNLNLLDQVYLNLILQFLSEQNGFGGITNATTYYQSAYQQVQNMDYSAYNNILNNYCGTGNDAFKNFGQFYAQATCNQPQINVPSITGYPSFETRYNQSLDNRKITKTGTQNTSQTVMCEVTQKLIKGDVFNFNNNTPGTYDACVALEEVMKIRTTMYNIQQSMTTISATVEDVINQIDAKIPTSFAATAESNLKMFFSSVFSNIDQTTKLSPSVPVVTVYDVITKSGTINNVQHPLELVRDQLLSLCDSVISTGFTSLVPRSISALGNGALNGFDNLSLAAYFGFLFYFVGCQISICFSLHFIRRYNYERYIKKRYRVRRPRYNCCGSAFYDIELYKQTKYDIIKPHNKLKPKKEDEVSVEDQEEACESEENTQKSDHNHSHSSDELLDTEKGSTINQTVSNESEEILCATTANIAKFS